MANIKISELPAGSTITDTSLFEISQHSITYTSQKFTAAQLASYFGFSSSLLLPSAGGTGVANNDAATLTRVGSFPLTFTLSAPTSLSFPTSGTLATEAYAQPVNANLTSISGITASNDDIIQRKLGAWVNRSMAQLLSDLSISSGTYTPTSTNVSNASSSTAYECQYIKVGSIVSVSGKIEIDPILTATSTQIGLSLPFASDFANAEDCSGTCFCPTISGLGASILADTVNNRAQIQYVSSDIGTQTFYFFFQFQVI